METRWMRYVSLGRSELEVSVLALGCGGFGGVGSAADLIGRGDDEQTAFALMDAAREHGITLFDTANESCDRSTTVFGVAAALPLLDPHAAIATTASTAPVALMALTAHPPWVG